MKRPTAPRNPGIDLLRGLSILLMILQHVALRIPLKRGLLATVVPDFVSNPCERALRTWWAVGQREILS
jgi:uncharacterized membrane protein